jgi:hypothetical protein
MGEYLSFKKMITPVIIQILFWLGIVTILVSGLGTMFAADGGFLPGLAILILGSLFWRVWCELVIVFFSINDSLTDIRRNSAAAS